MKLKIADTRITITNEEVEVIQRALYRHFPADQEPTTQEIRALITGHHWTTRPSQPPLAHNVEIALKNSLAFRIGGNQTHDERYATERSALLALLGIPEEEALDLALNCGAFRHPPTGNLLHLYLLTSDQVEITIHAGLKALKQPNQPS